MSPSRTAEAQAGAPSPDAGEARCPCGSLLARLCDDGVELKCRRCERGVLLPWPADRSWREIEPSGIPTLATSPAARPRFSGGIPPAGMSSVPAGRSSPAVRRKGAF
ncbi:MAG: hypothetical protein FJ144_14515 [Deltaproteobacteria bacterium]|nr:hypothetical protein [Deltaproteobacteria bacterium]